METDTKFFRHPKHRLWLVNMDHGPQILILDYCRKTILECVFEAKTFEISQTNFINTIIPKCLVNFLAYFGSA